MAEHLTIAAAQARRIPRAALREACLARIAALDAGLHAFHHLDQAGARAASPPLTRRSSAAAGRLPRDWPKQLRPADPAPDGTETNKGDTGNE